MEIERAAGGFSDQQPITSQFPKPQFRFQSPENGSGWLSQRERLCYNVVYGFSKQNNDEHLKNKSFALRQTQSNDEPIFIVLVFMLCFLFFNR